MNDQSNDVQWFIARDGQQHGPLSEIEMRTFVGHSYLRPTDLIWRAGMADWQPAPSIFPAAFQAPQPTQAPPPQAPSPPPSPTAYRPQLQPDAAPHSEGFSQDDAAPAVNETDYGVPPRRAGRQIAIGLGLVVLIAGSAVGYAFLRNGSSDGTASNVETITAPSQSGSPDSSAKLEQPLTTAAVDPATGAAAPFVEGSTTDARLQKIPFWTLIKTAYPEWYRSEVGSADALAVQNRSDIEVSTYLASALVKLRRQNAEKALAASPASLKRMATAFLDNLKALSALSTAACYGFIAKGEASPAIIEIMLAPDKAQSFHLQVSAIFEAAVEGAKSPSPHAAAVKADYDLLIAELNKIGWTEEDLQVFSNPRLLSKRDPAQVCKMVQEWFQAHLSVADEGAQERLLFETLKPVVSG